MDALVSLSKKKKKKTFSQFVMLRTQIGCVNSFHGDFNDTNLWVELTLKNLLTRGSTQVFIYTWSSLHLIRVGH